MVSGEMRDYWYLVIQEWGGSGSNFLAVWVPSIASVAPLILAVLVVPTLSIIQPTHPTTGANTT